MEFLWQLVDMFLHLDTTLGRVIAQYDTWTYLILFAIIFCETGLVVTPFLPGDSLLFAAGTFAAGIADQPPQLQLFTVLPLLMAAAILGDTTNYWIGRKVGPKIFHKENVRFLNKEHLNRAHAFYERYGPITVAIARFAPILRTFAPFVAGIGSMKYTRFLMFSIAGTIAWISAFVLGGYFFGNIPWVKKNFTIVIMAIIVISLLPAVITYIKARLEKSRQRAA